MLALYKRRGAQGVLRREKGGGGGNVKAYVEGERGMSESNGVQETRGRESKERIVREKGNSKVRTRCKAGVKKSSDNLSAKLNVGTPRRRNGQGPLSSKFVRHFGKQGGERGERVNAKAEKLPNSRKEGKRQAFEGKGRGSKENHTRKPQRSKQGGGRNSKGAVLKQTLLNALDPKKKLCR